MLSDDTKKAGHDYVVLAAISRVPVSPGIVRQNKLHAINWKVLVRLLSLRDFQLYDLL